MDFPIYFVPRGITCVSVSYITKKTFFFFGIHHSTLKFNKNKMGPVKNIKTTQILSPVASEISARVVLQCHVFKGYSIGKDFNKEMRFWKILN